MLDENIGNEDVTKGNWNISKGYTYEKILKWLILIDQYKTLSIFGFSKIESDIMIKDKNLRNTSRIQSLKRLVHSILALITNTKFAIKKEDRKEFDKHSDRLIKIEKNIWKLREEKKRGNRIVELDINESLFDKIMEEIDFIIDDVNFKLNKSNLIFAQKEEELDPKKIKQGFEERYINRQ